MSKFKVGDTTRVDDAKFFNKDISNRICTIISIVSDVCWVTNDEVKKKYPNDPRYAILIKDLRPLTKLERALR